MSRTKPSLPPPPPPRQIQTPQPNTPHTALGLLFALALHLAIYVASTPGGNFLPAPPLLCWAAHGVVVVVVVRSFWGRGW
ncbi:uncharacterized protein K452DRAFT_290076 [Aplosporella prunicola CBS 121167]|uniref:Uncharacterized protein n=1 Tax=Aplosporella prunicola CBS 121167 TaxID=1176127 RepID=A0A6A6B545_9PEZI|nr:uncharacterized protein K452DRAFT_290076 [Aplosporella prunicola CBS 121167]KAF2138976.1 hypothetical protein K452DRAFT_290076 [Aplosporella prunicola CBS 121167]